MSMDVSPTGSNPAPPAGNQRIQISNGGGPSFARNISIYTSRATSLGSLGTGGGLLFAASDLSTPENDASFTKSFEQGANILFGPETQQLVHNNPHFFALGAAAAAVLNLVSAGIACGIADSIEKSEKNKLTTPS